MAKTLADKLRAMPAPKGRLTWADRIDPKLLAEIDQAIDQWHAGDAELLRVAKDRTALARALILQCGLPVKISAVLDRIDERKPDGSRR